MPSSTQSVPPYTRRICSQRIGAWPVAPTAGGIALVLAAATTMGLAVSCLQSNDFDDFIAFVEGLPDGTPFLPAIAQQYGLGAPSFSLGVASGSELAVPAEVHAATIHVREVQ